MHILELPSFFPPHGGEFCLEQSRALAALGHEVRILSCTQLAVTVDRSFYWSAPRGYDWIEMEGIPCMRSYVHGLPKLTLWNEQHWQKTVLEMYADYREQFGRPDLIHAHCTKWAGIAARLIARKEDIPYYITEHLSSILYRKDFGPDWEHNRWAQDLLREAMYDADCVIPVAEELVADLRPFFGDSYRYQAISNIVDVDFFSPAPKAIQQEKGSTYRFLCLARADVKGKGFDLLSEAIKGDWLSSHQAELHIAGRNTETLRRLFPQREVVIHGNLDKAGVRELIWKSDSLVLPTRCEAQGLVLLEAMSCGIPVVTTTAVPKIVQVDGAAWVIPTEDIAALAQAMESVMRQTPKPEEIRAKIQEIAAPQSVAKQLEKLFSERKR